MTSIIIECSEDQKDVIEEHLLFGAELGVLPDEKYWMLSQARKQHPNCRILSANLDIENAEWHLELNLNS